MTTTGAARPLVIANRGASTVAPEHTIPAYEAAVEAGADALALDVHLSADDQLVVIHDSRLERTTDGWGAVRDHTLRHLKRLDAGQWFGPAFRGQRIQTLTEVLERFRDRVAFGVTLRGSSGVYPGIEERLVSLLQIYAVTDRTLVASFEHAALRRCRDLDSDLRVSVLGTEWPPAPGTAAPPGLVHGVCFPADRATAAHVAACRAAGVACYVGVVNDPITARRLAAWGVAGISTDQPDLLRPALDPLG